MKYKSTLIAFILGVTLILIFSFKTYNTDDQKSLGKVLVIEGKYVFMSCTPIQPYETAFEYSTVVHGMGCPSISEMAQASVKNAMKKGFLFDAVILGDTKYDLAIKFKQ
jgi:hypothetical protein